MKLIKNDVTKGIVFAGCSFTWGSGLWYYSNSSTIIEQNGQSFDRRKMNLSHIKYMESVRFPRVVANHFNTYDVVKFTPSGTDEVSLSFLELLFC